MLVIPLPTRGLSELRVLITDYPGEASAAGVPAVTPDLAAVLRQRWAGARYAERDGEREIVLPLRYSRLVA
jgi:hypothetical protein